MRPDAVVAQRRHDGPLALDEYVLWRFQGGVDDPPPRPALRRRRDPEGQRTLPGLECHVEVLVRLAAGPPAVEHQRQGATLRREIGPGQLDAVPAHVGRLIVATA